jgi:hypothetical protein
MKIAVALDIIVPAAQYFGSLTANTRAAYDAIEWRDDRAKPTWADIAAASITLARIERISELTADCGAAIVSGFASSALGSPYRYPYKTTDQINLMGAVSASLLPGLDPDWTTPFWCADADGQWSFRSHSAAQIQAVGRDGKAHVVACQTLLAQLTTAVSAATTVEAVKAIVWPTQLGDQP